jgi:hypothetical protein
MATAALLPDGYLKSRRNAVHPDVYTVTARESDIDVGLLTYESDGWHAISHFADDMNPAAHADPADALADLIEMVEETLRWCYVCGNAVDEEGQRQAISLDLRAFCVECRHAGYDGPECEPAGAFGYWPGEDARPSPADRPDGIGPEEAAQIRAEGALS